MMSRTFGPKMFAKYFFSQLSWQVAKMKIASQRIEFFSLHIWHRTFSEHFIGNQLWIFLRVKQSVVYRTWGHSYSLVFTGIYCMKTFLNVKEDRVYE